MQWANHSTKCFMCIISHSSYNNSVSLVCLSHWNITSVQKNT